MTGNSASTAGGTSFGSINNSIIYDNVAQTDLNYSRGVLNYCCTFPLPNSGGGNFTNAPQLASALHVSGDSPCIGSGSGAYSSGVDIDGEPWENPPSIGCDEYRSGSITGLVSVAILASYTNVATGFLVHLRADITGHASANRWELGVGTVPSNRPNLFYSWGTAGDYPVVLRVYNESYPSGISATLTIQVLEQPTHYVALGNANPLPPCTSWSTAAANIQDAVDVAFAGGTVLVTNGVYDKGGRAVHGTLTNRVVVMKLLVLSSVNGPGFTVIQGYQLPGQKNGVGAVRCVYLAGDSKLVGFTLLTGVTSSGASESPLTSGGGIWCESSSAVVENCTVLSNSAAYSAGGAFWGTFTNCMFIRNNLPDGYGGAVSNRRLFTAASWPPTLLQSAGVGRTKRP